MTKATRESQEKRQKRNETVGSPRKVALAVGLVFVGVVAAGVALNFDQLFARSDTVETVGRQAGLVDAPNTAPVILSVTPAAGRIEPFDLCKLVCEARDDDGDVLTYTWVASAGEVFGAGATVEWGSPIDEGASSLSVTVDDGRGGIAEQSIQIDVKANHAPEIVSMTASADSVIPGASTYVSCLARDEDGDEVSYEWVVDGGEVFGRGPAVVWLAPADTGSWWVRVVARDAYGGVSKSEVPVSVTLGVVPTLGEFVVSAIETDMLRYSQGVWDIFRGRSCSIECVVAEGMGPFTYVWTADRGTLTVERAVARWDAPNEQGPATILVEVTDANGNSAGGKVLMYVETCTCKF